MKLIDLLEKRRSCRAFKDIPVTQEQIDMITRAGQWAPSPLNQQPFQFIAITDPDVKAMVQKTGIEAKEMVAEKGGPGWAKKYPMNFISESPLILTVVYDPEKGGLGNYFNQPHGALQSASACIQNMMLMAEDLGLGSLWFTFFEPESLKQILHIPEKLDIAGALMVGTPAMEAKAPPRNDPKLHINCFK